ncbi:hypothetical protein MTR67_017703 [Solanum verrucosum]|uniref:Retrotransposon gag domain-containing protein n=1 Tax=Solanum verrucosum TaxID=315347 RepID=A0AAF0QL00_SOLVR|nr:hypothetical protein MTR67_017703 [Solanum verrucosum]
MTNMEFRSAFQELSQAVKAQDNREAVAPVNPGMGTTAARDSDFTRMNLPKFYGSKLEEDPQEFIVEVYKWKEARSVEASPIEWESFKSVFLDRFFPLEMREAKVLELINLRKGNMSVREYALRFTQLSKYGPSIGADRRAKMSKFVSGVSDLVVKECRTDILVHDMDISRLMVYAQQIEEEKLKERSKEVKRDKVDDGNYSHARSGGRGRSRFQQSSSGKFLQVILRGQEMRGCLTQNHKEKAIGLRCLLV